MSRSSIDNLDLKSAKDDVSDINALLDLTLKVSGKKRISKCYI